MAQYEKLINLSLLNQFLTKAKTIFAPKITASGILKGDGAGNVSAATAGTDYATPAQSLALGLTGASVGDLVRVNSVDSSGKPTSWKKVALNEIKCNKNYLINHYMVGGGSQLGDGVFPINQRGQTTYSNNGYGLDMWYSLGPKIITASGTEFDVTHAANSNNLLQQPINPDFFVGKTISLSALFSDNTLIYLENIVFNGVNVRSADETFTGFVIGIFVNNYPQSSQTVFRAWATQMVKNVTLVDCKLELGPEQTLCHNEGTEENPVWVLNEIPYYETELLRCISSHADTSDNFANKDYASALKVGPRIESGDNVDNYHYLYQAGTYAIASNVTNSPESWSIMLVIPSPSGECRQIAFGASKIYLRAYSGSPLAWSAWKSITLS